MQSLNAVDSKSFTFTETQRCQVQKLQLGLVQDGAFERHSHEPGEPSQPMDDLLHDSQRRFFVRDHDGGEAEMRSHIRPSGQRFQKRRPLGAEGATDVHDVNPRLPLHRFQQRSVPSNMPKRCPGTRILIVRKKEEKKKSVSSYSNVNREVESHYNYIFSFWYLELKDHVAHGLEAIRLLSRRGEAAVATGTGARDLAEESLHEVGDQPLVGVSVRGGALVQDPHDALHSGSVSVSNGSCAVQKQRLRPRVLGHCGGLGAAGCVVAVIFILEYCSRKGGGLEVAGVPVQGVA